MKNRKKFASAYWCVRDILDHAEEKDIPVTPEEAKDFLERHEELIADSMVATGWAVISDKFYEDLRDNKIKEKE